MKGNLIDYIKYRLKRADITFKDAKVLAANKSWNSCVNRLYYACFYSVSALMIKKGQNVKTHNGLRTIFFKEYIASGLIDKEYGKLYSDLFDWRSESDYADFIDYDSKTVTPMIAKVETFLKIVKNRIKTT